MGIITLYKDHSASSMREDSVRGKFFTRFGYTFPFAISEILPKTKETESSRHALITCIEEIAKDYPSDSRDIYSLEFSDEERTRKLHQDIDEIEFKQFQDVIKKIKALIVLENVSFFIYILY